MSVEEEKKWLLCLTCKLAEINELKKNTDKYIKCLSPKKHPQFNITYFEYLKHPVIACKFYKRK
jgi:hypothetical protein